MVYKVKLTAILTIATVTFSLHDAHAQNLDVDILKSINPRDPNSQYWLQTSNSAYWMPAAVSIGQLAYGIINNDPQQRHNAFETIVSVGVGTLISHAVKVSANRERPAEKYPDKIFVSSPTSGKSFPSGHTTLVFATATTVALQYRKWYVTVPAYVWAGAVAYSRMHLGKHYPSDVLGGIVVGVGSGYLCHRLTRGLLAGKPKNVRPYRVD